MPRSCCVFSCFNNSQSQPNLRFYILPYEDTRRKAWLKAINRAHVDKNGVVIKSKLWSPKTRYHYVCSEHFLSGKKSNIINDPDFIPSVFHHKSKKQVSYKYTGFDRHKRRQKKLAKQVSTKNFELKADFNAKDESEDEPIDFLCLPSSSTPPANDMPSATPSIISLQTPVTLSERESFYKEMDSLRAECERLKLVSKNQNKCAPFTIEMLKKNPEKCVMLTGLKYEIMLLMMDYLCEDQINYFNKLALKDQILMTLIKLKHNISFNMLAFISSISKTTMISYFWKWIDIMYVKLKFLIKMQDRNDIYKTIPPVFKAKFPRLTCIIDCFEIFIESPRCLLARAKCYSQYKKHCTIKVMISCTPLGAVNFLSQCWGGRASDNQIVRESNFHLTKYHMPGDQILADRGFTLADDFAAGSGAELFVPAFTKGKDQLSSGDVETTRKIASVRIHIERVIGLIKNRYTILKGILPFRTVKNIKDETMNETLSSCDKIISVCASLINLDTSIVTSPGHDSTES